MNSGLILNTFTHESGLKKSQLASVFIYCQLSSIMFVQAAEASKPNLKIVLFPLTRHCFIGMGQSIRNCFFFNFTNWIPIKLYVYSKTCLIRPLKKQKQKKFQDRLSHNAGQKYCRMLPGSILQYFRPSFNLLL